MNTVIICTVGAVLCGLIGIATPTPYEESEDPWEQHERLKARVDSVRSANNWICVGIVFACVAVARVLVLRM